MDRAEPAISRAAASTSRAFIPLSFCAAISRHCAMVTVPAETLPGSLEPAVTLAAFFRKNDAGGDFISKVKDLSWNAVITTGTGEPCSIFCVAALKALQNSMMLRPRCPSAGPIGGDG